MFKKNNKIILLIILIVLVFVAYRFLRKQDNLGNSSLVAETGQVKQSAIGQELLTALSKLKSLTLDENFFKDPVFQSLNDFSVPIASQDVGRANPFSPIGGSSVAVSSKSSKSSESSSDDTATDGSE